MGLTNITGVLSRYFVLGFYVPAFFTLVALAQLLTADFQPRAFEDIEKRSDEVLVLGGVALLVGLVLLGLRYPITRLLEGYPLVLGPMKGLARPLVWLQEKSYDRLKDKRDDKSRSSAERTAAARMLDRRFHDNRDKLLPTRFGNAYRAFEYHSYKRWGLDHIAAWPRVDALLGDQERDLHTNAASDVAFFVNSVLGAFAVGVLLVADGLTNEWAHGWWAYVLPFVIAYLIYRAAVGAAERVGTERRVSVDLHRLELYDRLGVRAPRSFTDEKTVVTPAVNRSLLWGEPIPDHLAKRPDMGKGSAK